MMEGTEDLEDDTLRFCDVKHCLYMWGAPVSL